MKTPMQEHIEFLKKEKDEHGYEKHPYFECAIKHAESMLEKEVDIFELLLDFADYAEADKNSQTTDECVYNYLDSLKNTKER